MQQFDYIIVDANNLCHRNFYVHRELTANVDGKDVGTGIAFGCLGSILKLLNTIAHDNSKFIFVWDRNATRKKELYSEYKANRNKDWEFRDEFIAQVTLFEEVLSCIGIDQAFMIGEEADDVMASLVKQIVDNGNSVCTVSNDHDIQQVIKDNSSCVLSAKSKSHLIIDYISFVSSYNVDPSDYDLYITLIGDKGDNVPGLYRVGIVTAKGILKHVK